MILKNPGQQSAATAAALIFALCEQFRLNAAADDGSMVFETLKVREEGAVLFAEIAAPPMNLLGPNWSAIWSRSFSKPRPTTPSRCSCSRAPTPTTSFPTST